MRYLSLFSGIEAATVSWSCLGWECAAVSEIDPFCCALLKHYYPDVPNLGDVTKISRSRIEDLGPIDLVVFGSPCQDLSVAGKRAGIEGERSGLFFAAMHVVRWSGVRFALWENVPGAFSSNRGRDFAAVVREMVGVEPDVPDGRWSNSGVALGPDGLLEWCVLDAQFFGVPQRRRRIFALRDSGNWADRPPILLEPESLRGNPPARRKTKEEVAGALGGGAGERGWRNDLDRSGAFVSMSLNAKGGRGRMDGESETFVAHTLRGDGCDASEDGTGRGAPLVPTAFSAKDHGADAGPLAPTLRAMQHDRSHANAGGQVAVCFESRVARNGRGGPSEIVPPLKAQSGETGRGDGAPLVAAQSYVEPKETHSTTLLRQLRAAVGEEAFSEWGLGVLAPFLPTEILQSLVHGRGIRPETLSRRWLVRCASCCEADLPARSVQSVREAHCDRCPPSGWQPSEQFARELGTYMQKLSHPGPSAETVMRDLRKADEGSRVLRQAFAAIQEAWESVCDQDQSARHGVAVRRLTPIEAEFLQGFPRGYTLIPYRGKPAADGPRYRAIGNSMAVDVMRWIGRRIQMVDSIRG